MDKGSLSAIQQIALAGCIKDKDLDALKDGLADGTSQHVDFCVRVFGQVMKGQSTAGGPTSTAATVSLVSLPIFCAVLQICGIGKDRLRRALEEIEPSSVKVNKVLSDVFDEVATAKAAKLPPNKGWAGGRRGSVTSNVNAMPLVTTANVADAVPL